jgi:hypothetical protein
MNEVGLPFDPRILEIGKKDLLDSLCNLRTYVESRPKLWYTVINDSAITRQWAEEAIQDLPF